MTETKPTKPMIAESKLFTELAEVLNTNELSEIEYDTDSFRIRLVKHSAPVMQTVAPTMVASAPIAATSTPTQPTSDTTTASGEDWDNHAGCVKSPMVGVVYTSKDPSSPPFIKEGDTVTVGQTLFLIEAMKTFNPVKSEKAGKVLKVLIDNANPVEYGEALVVIG